MRTLYLKLAIVSLALLHISWTNWYFSLFFFFGWIKKGPPVWTCRRHTTWQAMSNSMCTICFCLNWVLKKKARLFSQLAFINIINLNISKREMKGNVRYRFWKRRDKCNAYWRVKEWGRHCGLELKTLQLEKYWIGFF